MKECADLSQYCSSDEFTSSHEAQVVVLRMVIVFCGRWQLLGLLLILCWGGMWQDVLAAGMLVLHACFQSLKLYLAPENGG